MAAVEDVIPVSPSAGRLYRVVPLAAFGLAVLAYLRTRRALDLQGPAAILYMLVPFGLMIWATAPFINNDCLGILGGALAVLGSVGLKRAAPSSRALMGVGLVLASAKLNEFILVALHCATMVALTRDHDRADAGRSAVLGTLLTGGLCLPYLAFTVRYGSPAPDTPGQSLLPRDLAEAQGLSTAPRLSFQGYVLRSLPDFIHAMDGGWLFAVTGAVVLARGK